MTAATARNAVSVVVAAAAMWMWHFQPDLESKSMHPIRTYGRIGKVVTNDAFSTRIDRYDVAKALTTSSSGSNTRVTDGLFLIIHFQARAEHEPYTMAHTRLETRGGLTYGEDSLPGIFSRSEATYQPLLWGSGTFVFEVPKDRLAGARVVVGQKLSTLVSDLTAENVIDLGIDKAKAAQLAARPAASYHLGD